MLSKQQVQHIAKLARLGLGTKELERYRKELSSILDYIEKLKEVDVADVSPMTHSVVIKNVMREDKAEKELPERINKLIEAAPQREKGYVRTKAIL